MNFVYPNGAVANILSFFISGLPGGVSYLLLAMVDTPATPNPTLSPNETPTPTPNTYPLKMNQVKTGHVAAFSEKRISCSINTWIRGPGICAFCTILGLGLGLGLG